MANHSVIHLKRKAKPHEVEKAFIEANNKRWNGKLKLIELPGLASSWGGEALWAVEAPGTRPKKPSPAEPDENLGFIFWLKRGCRGIEIRHVSHNMWIRWVQNIVIHEMARYFKVERFDGGDGEVLTNSAQFRDSFKEYTFRNFPKPTKKDRAYLKERFLSHIPKGWK